MGWHPNRLRALAALVFLLLAQVHVWVDAGPAQAPGHLCQFCAAGAWAVVSANPGLEVAQHILRLETEPPQLVAKCFRAATSAPRAPPQT